MGNEDIKYISKEIEDDIMKTYKPSYEFHPGDILLFKANYQGIAKPIGWLQHIFDGPVGHCEMIVEVLTENKVRCIGANFDGAKYRDHEINTEHAVKRLEAPIKLKSVKGVADLLLAELNAGEDLQYSYMGLLSAGFNAFMDRITLRLWKKIGLIGKQDNMFCSKLVAVMCRVLVKGFKFARKGEGPMHPRFVTPGDIYKSQQCWFVKDLGEEC